MSFDWRTFFVAVKTLRIGARSMIPLSQFHYGVTYILLEDIMPQEDGVFQ